MCNTCGCKDAESFEAEIGDTLICIKDEPNGYFKKGDKAEYLKFEDQIDRYYDLKDNYIGPLQYKVKLLHNNNQFVVTPDIVNRYWRVINEAESFEADFEPSFVCFICSKPANNQRGFNIKTKPPLADKNGDIWLCDEHDNLFDFGLFVKGNTLAWRHPNGTKYVQGKMLKDAESFEAQTKLTAFTRGKDWEGKPYTGQIFPDHPDLDPKLADRNKDGKMASWERAIGNQVAKGKSRFKAPRKMTKTTTKFTQRKPITAASSLLPYAIAVGALATILGLRGKE